MMSFKPEVRTNDPDWHGNACRFATGNEAEAYAFDLMLRWTSVRDIRVVESDDPITYAWVDGRAVPIKPGAVDA